MFSNILKTIFKLLLPLLSVLCNGAFAQSMLSSGADPFIITKRLISVENGLSSREVYCAAQDRDGFMWFGTTNGLCRFDGKSFRVFTKQNSQLAGNVIMELAIDDANRLYIIYRQVVGVATRGERVQILDLNTYTFKSLTAIFPNLPFKSSQIIRVVNDGTNQLNFVTMAPFQLWKYSVKKGFVNRCNMTSWDSCFKIENAPFVLPRTMGCIFQNGAAALQITGAATCYFTGVNNSYSFSPQKNQTIFTGINADQELLMNHFSDSPHSKRSSNWIFDKIDHKGKIAPIRAVLTKNSSQFFNNNLGYQYFASNGISDGSFFVKDQKGNFFLFKDSLLLQIYTSKELKGLADIGVWNYFLDNRGNRWLCTTVGVFEVSLRKNIFVNYLSQDQQHAEKNNQARGIYVGIDSSNDKVSSVLYANMWQHFFMQKKQCTKNIFSNDFLFSLINYRGDIYLGGNYLYKYHPGNNAITKIDTAGRANIWSMLVVSDSILLEGTYPGIYAYNIYTKKSVEVRYSAKNIPPPRFVYRFVRTKKNGIVAVAENGLYMLDANLVVVDYYGAAAIVPSHRLPVTTIYDMQEDRNGVCWIATNGDGLLRWDWGVKAASGKSPFRVFTITDGLPSMILYRIEEDGQGNLWVSTYNGLLRFSPANFTTDNFTIADGLSHNEFNRASSFKAADGIMYFGGMNGINAFLPTDFNNDSTKAGIPFRVVNFSKFSTNSDNLVDCMKEFNQHKKIVMEVGDKLLSVEFSVLDFDTRVHHYAYKIEGIDKDWNYISENSIRISGLPYGEFKIIIKAQLESGQWNSEYIEIPLAVLKPFYLNGWFLILFPFVLISLISLLFYRRINQSARDKVRLEKVIQQRTNSLEVALNDREVLLKEIHHRVKNNLQVISGLLQLQKEEVKDESAQAALNEGQSRVSSIALIHQNLYQHNDLGSITFGPFLEDLAAQINSLFEYPQRIMEVAIFVPDIFIDIDTAVPLGLIVNELLTNSYKYAFQLQHKIEVKIELRQFEPGYYQLVYRDNGPGIKNGVDFDTATSLGMHLIGGLADQLSGKATYGYDSGAVFTIYFKDNSVRKYE